MLLSAILVLYCFIKYSYKIKQVVKDFISGYYLVLILIFIQLASLLFSDKLHISALKDIINSAVVIFLFFILHLIISEKRDFAFLISNLLRWLIFFALFISIFGLLDILDITTFDNFIFRNDNSGTYSVNSMFTDYNFALLPVFFGMFAIFYYFTKRISIFKRYLYSFFLTIFTAQIFLSGSKRGFFLLIFILSLLLILLAIQFFNKNKNFKLSLINFPSYFLSLLLLALLFYLYIAHSTSWSKNRIFDYLGTKNPGAVKDKVTSNLLRCFYFFDRSANYDSLYQNIWSPVFDSKDPHSGWGRGKYKTIYPLYGDNVEIVPQGTIGYYLDSTCVGGDSNHAYFATLIKDSLISQNDIIVASVYCYVSKNYDGNVVAIEFDNIFCGRKTIEYNYNLKGTWQKLNLIVNCNQGKGSVYLYINKGGVTNFSSLKGYVIYAYPEYKIIRKSDSALKNLNDGKLDDYWSKQQTEKRTLWSDSIYEFNKLKNHNYDLIIRKELFKSSLAVINLNKLTLNISDFYVNKDPIRNWLSNLISEDTVYHAPRSELLLKSGSIDSNNDRFYRWKFALEIFTKEYTWPRKVFGGGFNFLNWYGYYFYDDKKQSDYPHNPMLYILLYSGIFGLTLYLFFLFKIFNYYLKYIREYPILFIFFLISFYFTFFSGGGPFDPPIMGFFVILPFFIHSLYKKPKTK